MASSMSSLLSGFHELISSSRLAMRSGAFVRAPIISSGAGGDYMGLIEFFLGPPRFPRCKIEFQSIAENEKHRVSEQES